VIERREETPVAVGVVGLEDGPEAGCGPAVLACLDGERYRRIGIALHHFESGLWHDDRLDVRAAIPDHRVDQAGFTAALLGLVEEHGIRVLVPGAPHVVQPLLRAGPALSHFDTRIAVDPGWRGGMVEFQGVQGHAARHGIPTVRSWALGAGITAESFPVDVRWPATLIARDGTRARAADPLAAVRAERRLRGLVGERVTLLEVLPGTSYEFAAVVHRRRTVARGAVRVLADDDSERPWLCVTVDHPELTRAAETIIASLDLEGPVLLSFVQASPDVFLVVDVRTTLPLWSEVGLVNNGNLVEVAVEHALGRIPDEPGHIEAGLLFSQTAEDVVIDPAGPLGLLGTR